MLIHSSKAKPDSSLFVLHSSLNYGLCFNLKQSSPQGRFVLFEKFVFV